LASQLIFFALSIVYVKFNIDIFEKKTIKSNNLGQQYNKRKERKEKKAHRQREREY
jgi:hypothetical protein